MSPFEALIVLTVFTFIIPLIILDTFIEYQINQRRNK